MCFTPRSRYPRGKIPHTLKRGLGEPHSRAWHFREEKIFWPCWVMHPGSSVVRAAGWATDLLKKKKGNSKISLPATGLRLPPSEKHCPKAVHRSTPRITASLLMTLCNECSYIKHSCMWTVPTQDSSVVLEPRRPTRSSILGLQAAETNNSPVRPYCTSTVRQWGRFFMHRAAWREKC